jgi:Cu/Ag efflux protein CusF
VLYPNPAAGTKEVTAGLSLEQESRETAMKIAKLILAGTAALSLATSASWAQQDKQEKTAQVTQINRLNNTIAVRQVQSGTVGSNSSTPEEMFKVKEGLSLEDLHAGNRITYSTTESGGTKTITSFKKAQ